MVVGERFDLLLINDDQHALATIKTKTPYHKASKKERKDFEEKLSGFPTLRSAYFTNGPEWDRLDIVVTGGELSIFERSQFDTRKASPELAELFFAPLFYEESSEVFRTAFRDLFAPQSPQSHSSWIFFLLRHAEKLQPIFIPGQWKTTLLY